MLKKLYCNLKTRLKQGKRLLPLLRAHRIRFALWIAIGLIAVSSLWLIDYSRRNEELTSLHAVAKREAAALSSAYAQQIVRSLEKLDELTALFQYEWERSGRTLRLEDLAARGLLSSDHFASFLIVDANGNNVTSTRPNRSDAKFNDRRYFKQHQADPSSALKVSTPTVGKISNQRVIHVTRRINKPDGTFDGVLVVSVANDFFTPLSNDTIFGKEGLQAVVGDDGEVRVSLIGGELSPPPSTALKTDPQCMPLAQPTLVAATCFSDHRARFIAVTGFAGYPFKAVVGLSEHEILTPFLQRTSERDRSLWMTSGLIAFSCIFALLLSALLTLKREEASEIRKAYRLATENGKDGFFLWRKVEDDEGVVVDFQIVDCNERGAEMYGLSKSELVGSTFTSQYGNSPYRDFMVSSYRNVFERGHGEDNIEVPPQSLLKAKWLHRKYVRTFEGLAVTHSDIGDKIAAEQEMSRRAIEDNLTGLPNRYWLSQNLPVILMDAVQAKTKVAVLFLDLDDFKNVNDSRGHSAGDELLRSAADRLLGSVRPNDHVARFGGDEFTIVMRNITDESQVTGLANRIIDSLKTPFLINGDENVVGASVGIAIFPADGNDGETLLKNADIAMYAAKVEKGGYCFYSHDLYARREARLATEQEIVRALKADEFILYYQPRLRPTTREVVGMEALVRWASPARGLVPPSEFIPIAESSDLIVQLGEIIAEKVALQIKKWVTSGHVVVPVSVNVSARQFRKGRVQALIARLLAETRIDPALLQVEITESAMMQDEDEVGIQLAALDKMGVKTHVDDFGTGYSSLALLQRLSLDVLKIDRAFTATLGKNPESEILFRAIVSMGHALGMEVVAEGVETEEQLALIIKLGCDEVQGFLFAKPMPACEAEQIILPPKSPQKLLSTVWSTSNTDA